MIRFLPTADSGLSATTYGVELPGGSSLNLGISRPRSVSRTISGEGVFSLWPAKISGTETSFDVTATDEQYRALRLMAEHASVTEWIMQANGRTFRVGFDVASAQSTSAATGEKWALRVSVFIVSELHR